jgi:hypothetical protein
MLLGPGHAFELERDAWSLVFLFSQQQPQLRMLLNACMPVHGNWFSYFRSSSRTAASFTFACPCTQ